ncbi:hypothetical protein DSO57_1017017 [Entomophthora muscae]|uniref:Uncharacterized protein n=1 Tax=Entomophthora muscae TaxID=34485 RepID=A0ACC2RW63_9FUNG|nr:hypothetical protein DSO57_1017017 [Entomophthora muscae]
MNCFPLGMSYPNSALLQETILSAKLPLSLRCHWIPRPNERDLIIQTCWMMNHFLMPAQTSRRRLRQYLLLIRHQVPLEKTYFELLSLIKLLWEVPRILMIRWEAHQ